MQQATIANHVVNPIIKHWYTKSYAIFFKPVRTPSKFSNFQSIQLDFRPTCWNRWGSHKWFDAVNQVWQSADLMMGKCWELSELVLELWVESPVSCDFSRTPFCSKGTGCFRRVFLLDEVLGKPRWGNQHDKLKLILNSTCFDILGLYKRLFQGIEPIYCGKISHFDPPSSKSAASFHPCIYLRCSGVAVRALKNNMVSWCVMPILRTKIVSSLHPNCYS